MNIIESLQWRYATKKFDKNKAVSDSKIEILKQAFNLTATSYGLQPLKLVVLANKEVQKKLVPASYNQQQVEQASHVLIICVENVVDEKYIRNYFELVKEKRGTSDALLSSFRDFLISDFNKKTEQEIKQASVKQAYLALGNLLTVCAVEKIDACPMEGFDPKQYSTILNIDEEKISPVLVLPVGYRASDDMFAEFQKVRKNLEDSIINI